MHKVITKEKLKLLCVFKYLFKFSLMNRNNQKYHTVVVNETNDKFEIDDDAERNGGFTGIKNRKLSKIFENVKIVDLIDTEQPSTKSRQYKFIPREVNPIGSFFNDYVLIVNLPTPTPIIENENLVEPVLNSFLNNLIIKYSQLVADDNSVSPQNVCVLICKDQEGSRFIQEQLDIWSQNEIDLFFSQILSQSRELSTNLFGNYVIQKILTKLNKEQLEAFSTKIDSSISDLIPNMFGCRVIQAYLNVNTNNTFILEDVSKNLEIYIKNSFSNHVVQKCLEVDNAKIIYNEIIKNAHIFAKEKYGCRIIQSIIKNDTDNLDQLLKKLFDHAADLIIDQYGNYVIQVLISNNKYKEMLLPYVIANSRKLSLCKYSSNIVEKYVNTTNSLIITKFYDQFNIKIDGELFLLTMIKDGCANYVVQTLFTNANDEQRKVIKETVRENSEELSNLSYYKVIQHKFLEN